MASGSFWICDRCHCYSNSNKTLCKYCVNDLLSEAATSISGSSHIQQNLDAIKRESYDLFEQIMKCLSDRNFVSPEVILFLGNPGVYKPAIINNIYEALTGISDPKIARAGAGDAQTIKESVNWYMNCGVNVHDIDDSKLQRKLDSLLKRYPHIPNKQALVKRLPHFIDVSGFSGDSKHETLLELLIGGFFSPKTRIDELECFNEKELRTFFGTSIKELKVTKICFVHNTHDGEIPNKLIACVRNVLRKMDSDFRLKYTADAYMIFSKWDLVWDQDSLNESAIMPPLKRVTAQDAQKRRVELLSKFNMIENNTLLFMNNLMKPPSLKTRIADKITKLLTYVKTGIAEIFIVICGIIVYILFLVILFGVPLYILYYILTLAASFILH